MTAPHEVMVGKFHFAVNEFIQCSWCTIFNSPGFFKLHRTPGSFYYQLWHGTPAVAVAVGWFSEVEPHFYRSPGRGTFGGFEFSHAFALELLEGFIARVHAHLTEAEAREIELVLAPMYIRS